MGNAINAWHTLLKKDPEFLLVGTIRDFFIPPAMITNALQKNNAIPRIVRFYSSGYKDVY